MNSNYQDFLNLGNSLHGGEEKVEEVRVGLLGFRKEVEGLREGVRAREEEVGALLDERRDVRVRIGVGRRMVDYGQRVRELEVGLEIGVEKNDVEDSEEEEDDEDDEEEEEEDDEDEQDASYGVSIAKLRRNVVQYRLILQLEKGLGGHPFVVAQAPRMAKVRSTLLLDLSTALKQAKSAGSAGSGRVMKVMRIYADMGEEGEAVRELKSLKAT